MRLVSTRDPGGTPWTFRDALLQGLAPDGGLFNPVDIEPLATSVLGELRGRPIGDVAAAVAEHLLGARLGEASVSALARASVDFPFPLTPLGAGESILELFHGPTLAFKDVGARFMAGAMSALCGDRAERRTILVATSGDTGGAVAQAFRDQRDIRVVILFPEGKVSPRQRAQLSVPSESVTAVAVGGAFDDCQRLVKEAFADLGLRKMYGLTSANSINVGRLLPQTFYHLYGALAFGGTRALFVSVPSGNLGNLTAGLVARTLGAPIAGFVAATNTNRVFPDYLDSGLVEPRPSSPTISNAMDVGHPSNVERILHMFGGDVDRVREVVTASAWTDEETARCIAQVHEESGVVLDPHTAVGLLGLRGFRRAHPDSVGLVLGTAHPAKFAETVEPLIGRTVAVPPSLQRALERTGPVPSIGPRLADLADLLGASS